MISVDGYLNFPGNALEAFEFYRSVFGGELEQHLRYRDFGGDSGFDSADADRTAHVSLRLTPSFALMGSDVPERAEPSFVVGTNHYLNLNMGSAREAEQVFEALSRGGQVESPLSKTAWADLYGSLTDRFGVRWMINFTSE